MRWLCFWFLIPISCADGLNGVRLSKRDCARSYYQPPPPSDIEQIRRNMVKQQKARALIMEILGKRTGNILRALANILARFSQKLQTAS